MKEKQISKQTAFLFAWNSKPERFEGYMMCLKKIAKKGTCNLLWRCDTVKINPGDRVFLMKLGKFPKGIIGSGKALTFPDDGVIKIQLDTLLNSDEKILDIANLQKGRLAQQNWTPQMNGIAIRNNLLQPLEEKWADYLQKQRTARSSGSITTAATYMEGLANEVVQIRYERNLQARIACLKHHGFSCSVCGFNFERQYGPLGRNFIHVHHIIPISKIGKEYTINPVKDLRPVCPNCHAMLHKLEPQLTIKKLKNILKRK